MTLSEPRKEPYAKLLYLLRRKEGLSLSEFRQHWLDRHAEFGRRNPAILRYVQYHALADDPIRAALPQAGAGSDATGYDGMAVAWFGSAAELREAMRGDGVAAALEDESRFIDHSRSVALLADEYVVVDPVEPSPIVLVECLRKRQELSASQFSTRWLQHGEIGRKANARGLLQGYIQNHVVAGEDGRVGELESLGAGARGWDGIVTAYFHSVAVAKTLFQDPLAGEESFEDEKEFIDHEANQYFMAERHVIKDLVR